jgi:hypothetical protein
MSADYHYGYYSALRRPMTAIQLSAAHVARMPSGSLDERMARATAMQSALRVLRTDWQPAWPFSELRAIR